MQIRSVQFSLCLIVWLSSAGIIANAQEAGTSGASNTTITNLLEPGYLESRINSFSNRTDLPAETFQETLKIGQQCLALRDDLVRLASERAALLKTTQSASNQLAELRVRLKQPQAEAQLGIPADASTSALEQRAAEIEAEFSIAQAEQDQLDQEPKRRAERRVKVASLLAEYRKNIETLESQTSESVGSGDPEELSLAYTLRRTLTRELNLQKIRNLNLELASYEATSELVADQQVLARRKAALLAKQLADIKEALNASRAEESARASEEAERARQRAEALHLPLVTALAETNKQLAETRVEVSDTLSRTSRELDDVEAKWKDLQADHESVRQLVQIARESGVADDYAIGLALRQVQYSLPSEKRLQEEVRVQAEQMTIARIDRSKLADRERAGADIEVILGEIREALPATLQAWQKDEALQECRRLLQEQRTLFADLTADYDALVVSLARVISAQKNWLSEIGQFNELIAEQVLWFRSTDVLSVQGMRDEVQTISSVVSDEIKAGLWPYLKKDAQLHPFVYLTALVILLALLVARWPLANGLRRTCPPHLPEGRLSVKPALLSLLFTTILTIPIPAVLLFLAWRVAGYSGGSALADQWTHAFWWSGTGVMVIEFFRQACRIPGLATAHLRWPEHNARLMRFHFTWLIIAAVSLGVLSDLLEGVFLEGVTNRMLFMTAQVLLLLLGHLLLRANGGLRFSTHDGESAVQKPLRLQRLYHAVAIAIPLLLIGFSVMGYTYTARQVWLRVGDSIQWGLVLLLATMFILHWLTVLRRRLAVAKVEHRKAEGESKGQSSPAGPDLWQVYSQSRRMFSTLLWIIMAIGLWFIWSDMLPALKKLDRIPIPFLSQQTGDAREMDTKLVTGLVTPPGGKVEQAPQPSDDQTVSDSTEEFLSVGDVIGAVIVLLLTMAASRNLPGFVEMVLLSRVRFRQGEGYAIVTILRYTVLLLGIGWSLTLIGITWNKVQWLAAAVTVGIGFGLQEIFANFVSGLILLFERPVRVGDVITVGNVTGKVTRIQMRATTVRNWDQQELVLPNKDLITGQVINWTLSDDVSRLALTVGVSYDADVKLATKILLEIAEANQKVKSDPKPFVAFEEFGDSTLNLVLRAYVSIEVRLLAKSELHNAILERFRQEGIEIAYPQRDLHIRSVTAEIPPLRPSTGASDASRS